MTTKRIVIINQTTQVKRVIQEYMLNTGFIQMVNYKGKLYIVTRISNEEKPIYKISRLANTAELCYINPYLANALKTN